MVWCILLLQMDTSGIWVAFHMNRGGTQVTCHDKNIRHSPIMSTLSKSISMRSRYGGL